MSDIPFLDDEKKRILAEFETWMLQCPEVAFCGVSYNTQEGAVHVVVGGASTRRMAITAGSWIARLQEHLPDVPLKLQLVRGQLKNHSSTASPSS